MTAHVEIECYRADADGPTHSVTFKANDDLDCPYLGWVRVVPKDGYIDVPAWCVTSQED